MDIVYSIDDHYVPQAAALTASILEHAQPSGDQNCPGRFSYVFHILSNEVSEENRSGSSGRNRRPAALRKQCWAGKTICAFTIW